MSVDRIDDSKRALIKRFFQAGTAAAVGVGGLSGLGGYGAGYLKGFSDGEERAREQTPINEILTGPEATEVNKDLLGKILQAPLLSHQRISMERSYVDSAQTLEQIDAGFLGVTKREERLRLMLKRWDLRVAGHPQLPKLAQDREDWLYSYRPIKYNGISCAVHPEVLAMCFDTYFRARDVLGKIKGDLRPDLKDKPDDLRRLATDDLMINPMGLATLAITETPALYTDFNQLVAFSYIGSESAVSQINDSAFPGAKAAVDRLAEILSVDTGLPFKAENIPGSYRGDPNANISGGAIGIQIMPQAVIEMYELGLKAGEKLNIFSPTDSLVMAWMFVARRQEFPQGVRDGYMRGDEVQVRNAIAKWNPQADQIDIIFDAAVAYWAKFVRGTENVF